MVQSQPQLMCQQRTSTSSTSFCVDYLEGLFATHTPRERFTLEEDKRKHSDVSWTKLVIGPCCQLPLRGGVSQLNNRPETPVKSGEVKCVSSMIGSCFQLPLERWSGPDQ
ncbi:hypothetical protein J6590_046062 [Homalodisca vitripennis]|nr:hypothetical protein J6590_046062 [Homalodisca vitripennis]